MSNFETEIDGADFDGGFNRLKREANQRNGMTWQDMTEQQHLDECTREAEMPHRFSRGININGFVIPCDRIRYEATKHTANIVGEDDDEQKAERSSQDALALDRVEAFLRRFVAYPSEHARVAHALWIAHTYLLDAFDTTPRMAFMSEEKMSGKTRALLEVTPLLVHKPVSSVNSSAAVMIRLADQAGGCTLLYDEIDAVFGSAKAQDANADLCSLMNAGYRRGAKVRRWNINTNAPQEFNAFAPLAVAGLRDLPDTLASRAIFIRMKRRAPNEKVEPFRFRNATKDAEPVRVKLEEWCLTAASKINLEGDPPKMPAGLEDRNADVWEPLLAVADVAGAPWPKRARDAAIFLTGAAVEETATAGTELLAHCRDAFGSGDRLFTAELIDRLNQRDESPWKELRNGQGINDRILAKRLKGYGVKSKDLRVEGSKPHKGYVVEDFKDAWNRYLTPAQGERDSRDKRDNIDNKNNYVADVAAVAVTPGGDADKFANLRDAKWRLK